MRRYFIELAYNGKNYHGWQIQPNAPTVQEELNHALSTILRKEINVVGAGRTDTGVHASFYVAHFDVEETIDDTEYLAYKLNRIVGKDIAISKVYEVSTELHARFSATSRTYKYYIDKQKNPFTAEYAARIFPQPHVEEMNEACKILFEYTDFTSFSKLHTEAKTNDCTIMEAHWEDSENQLIFTIKANRFLRNMVRAIVGTMIEIGQDKLNIDQLRKIIESKNRCNAGTSVPGHALFLCDITYPKDIALLTPKDTPE